MNIYTTEKYIKSILEYIKTLSNEDKTFYTKSKSRLSDISNKCLQITELIEGILNTSPSIENAESESNLSTNQVSDNLISKSDNHRISSTIRHNILICYRDSIQCAIQNSLYPAVEVCAQLLYEWFNSRFIDNKDTKFKYNIRRLPNWIEDIVIVYAKHLYNGDCSVFISEFKNWVKDSSNTSYAVPYEVFAVDKTLTCEYVTLTALVLWDILIDAGLSQLCKDLDVCIDVNNMYNRCYDVCPDMLDNYTNYRLSSNILLNTKIINEH